MTEFGIKAVGTLVGSWEKNKVQMHENIIRYFENYSHEIQNMKMYGT